jgi:hypothetical protein
VFYGCLDWHSSVHGHWMLVKLLKKFPTLANKARLTPGHLLRMPSMSQLSHRHDN